MPIVNSKKDGRVSGPEEGIAVMYTVPGIKMTIITAIVAACAFFYPPSSGGSAESVNTQAYLVVESDDGRVSIDARDVEIAELLRAVAQKTKTNISIGAGVSGKITVKLSAATSAEALKAICQNSAVVYEYLPDTNSWRVLRSFAVSGANGETPAVLLDGGTAGASGESAASQKRPGKIAAPEGVTAGARAPAMPSSPPAGASREKRPAYKAGELLVKFRDGATPEQIAALHARLGSVVIKNLPKLRLQRIKLKTGLAEAEAIRQYQEAAIVEHVELHALRYPQATPNDPGFPSQWNLRKIGAEALWNITTGNRDVIVAVIDSGVDYKHPDLRDNIWVNTAEQNGQPGVDDDGNGHPDDIYGWDFADNDNDPFDPGDSSGHGTHVAGIIGAVGNNGVGVSGVNWKIRIMPLKVTADGRTAFEEADIIEAIDYAIANGADVVNCSFGGSLPSLNEYTAFKNLKQAGILAVCAAGNYGNDMDKGGKIYPASYMVDNVIHDTTDIFCPGLDNILSVASTDSSDALAASSNYGKTTVDVAAPGESIYSTAPLSGTTASVRSVDASPAVEYPALGMEYAALTTAEGIAGALYDCGMGYSGYTCESEVMDQIPAAVSGNIALIQRGNCDGQAFYFSQKVANAMAKGAAGVIIYNNLKDDPYDDDNFDTEGGTLGAPGSWIPVVSISKTAGEALLSLLSKAPLRVALTNKPTVNPYKDMTGTSMAAPHVAGLAGLIYGQCPSVGYADIKAAIINTSDKIPALADKVASGGRINALASLTSMFPPGDLSGNCRLGLEDAIIALRLLANMDTPLVCPLSTPNCRLDVNNDAMIGPAEAIYILQKISGNR